MGISARRGDLQGQLIAVGRDGDPFAVFERMRAHGPLYRGRFTYVTTSLPVAREVLSSNDFRTGFDGGAMGGPLGSLLSWAAVPPTESR